MQELFVVIILIAQLTTGPQMKIEVVDSQMKALNLVKKYDTHEVCVLRGYGIQRMDIKKDYSLVIEDEKERAEYIASKTQ